MQQLIAPLRRRWQPSRANIKLQSIMDKFRLSKLGVPPRPPFYEFRFRRAVFEMLVCGFLVCHGGVWDWFGSVARGVVVAGVDSVGWWEGEELLHRGV